MVRHGKAGQDTAEQSWLVGVGRGRLCFVLAWQSRLGRARLGLVWRGTARHGTAVMLCCDEARAVRQRSHGAARRCSSGQVTACYGGIQWAVIIRGSLNTKF